MKKRYILILLIISLLFCINNVRAAKLTCKYEPDDTSGVADKITLKFKYTRNGDSVTYEDYTSNASGMYKDPKIIDFYVNEASIKQFIEKDLLSNDCGESSDSTTVCLKCPSTIKACMASNDDPRDLLWQASWWVLVSIKAENTAGFHDNGNPTQYNLNGTPYWIERGDCREYKYISHTHAGVETVNPNDSCDTLENDIKELGDLYKNGDYKQYYNKKDKVVEYCKTLLSTSDYEHAGDVNECMKGCIEINSTISGIENPSSGETTCGFSQRIIIWISNIIKWIKYIIQVIVIALGIIDFIKAIASSSDDEMKKAQGRFIKRLIAAALIFIIPFIIEFILDKTGFSEYVSGCGVIDL